MYYCILLFCDSITLLFYYIIILLYHHIIVILFYDILILLYYYITILLYYYINLSATGDTTTGGALPTTLRRTDKCLSTISGVDCKGCPDAKLEPLILVLDVWVRMVMDDDGDFYWPLPPPISVLFLSFLYFLCVFVAVLLLLLLLSLFIRSKHLP